MPPSAQPPSGPATPAVAVPTLAIDHYENFPVASLLCPAHLRPAIAAIYHFARTADDIADEGDATPAERLAALTAYRAELQQLSENTPSSSTSQWPQVFGPLRRVVAQHQLPIQLLDDLLDAFTQDIERSANAMGYADHAELRDYCRRSANPVGRLLLHLYGVNDPTALLRSDAICTALQLINFWQDLSIDLPRNRFYLPLDDCQRFGLSYANLQASVAEKTQSASATHLIAENASRASASMLFGAPLVHQIPGRAGWELRLVVQGGLRILDRMAAMNHATLTARPTLGRWDLVVMAWRALWM